MYNMSDIDYIKNVQISGLINGGNTISWSPPNLPIGHTPDEMVIKQIQYASDHAADLYCLQSSLTADSLASFLTTTDGVNASASVTPNITHKLMNPFSGDVIFSVMRLGAAGKMVNFSDEAGAIIINLELVRYKRK